MTKINIIRPPKISVDKRKSFLNQLVMIIVGTTISLGFTIAAAKLTDHIQRVKDRRLSALMVMSNIESFARTMETRSDNMAPADSLAAWLMSKPLGELEQMPEGELKNLLDRVTTVSILARDRSAENIFSNNIETWKNVGNVKFIDLVGACFSAMESVEEDYNNWVKDITATEREIKYHPDNYEGTSIPLKILGDEKMRRLLKGIHNRRCWLRYAAASLRYYNLRNMQAIGISEEEVMEFTDGREKDDANTAPAPIATDYYTAPISPDSLTTLSHLNARLDSIMGRSSAL